MSTRLLIGGFGLTATCGLTWGPLLNVEVEVTLFALGAEELELVLVPLLGDWVGV